MHARLRLVQPPPPEPPPPASAAPSLEARLADLHARKPDAQRWLVEMYGPLAERLILRVLGDRQSLEDHVQEVFVRVFARAADVRDASSLRAFIASVSVFVAREVLRKRRRHGWLRFFASDDLPEPVVTSDPEGREALVAVYRILGDMDLDHRVCFALRYIDGMELADVARACGWSLATLKRKLKRAEEAFVARCRDDDALRPWLEEGDRWT